MAGMTWSSSGEQPSRMVGRDPHPLPPPPWPTPVGAHLPQGVTVMAWVLGRSVEVLPVMVPTAH